jgi:L-iditol 2-dehydrogenase
MPSEMSYEEGALVEPFVVTLQAIRESGIGFSDSAVVVGTGTIGQLMVQTLKTIGAGTIIAIGRNPLKLELAKRMGATHVVNSTTEDAAARVRELTDGLGAMYGYEAVGSEQTFYQMVDYVRDGATVTFLGLLTEDSTPMPMVSSIIKNLKFATVIRYTNVFAEALTMLKYKRAEILPILTHKFPFEKAIDAFNEAINNKKDAIKVMINL